MADRLVVWLSMCLVDYLCDWLVGFWMFVLLGLVGWLCGCLAVLLVG